MGRTVVRSRTALARFSTAVILALALGQGLVAQTPGNPVSGGVGWDVGPPAPPDAPARPGDPVLPILPTRHLTPPDRFLPDTAPAPPYLIGDESDPSVGAPGLEAPPGNGTGSDLLPLETGLEEIRNSLQPADGHGNYELFLGGSVVADLLFSGARPVSPGTPFFLAPRLVGVPDNTFEGHARQTTLFAKIVGPRIGHEWETGASVAFNLYDNSAIADMYGLLPLQAYGEIRNPRWRFAAGLQDDIILPLNPTMLPFRPLAGGGNLGAIRLNAHVDRYLHLSPVRQATLTLGISEPVSTIINNRNPALVEDNGWPNLEGRMALGLGPLVGEGAAAARPIEVGLSGVIGELRRGDLFQGGRIVTTSWGLGGDARVALTERFGINGELYLGQAIGEYNGAVFQNLSLDTFDPVRTAGGWCEFYYDICPRVLRTHIGYGIDDPVDTGLAAFQPVRNETYFANLIWNITEFIHLGGEVTYRRTAYSALPDNDGLGFHTQFRWDF